jgi:hypothetical protein
MNAKELSAGGLLVLYHALEGSGKFLQYLHSSSQLDRIQKLYQTYHSGYRSSQKLGQYQKSRKSQKNPTVRKRKLDRSLSRLQFLFPSQCHRSGRCRLSSPVSGKLSVGWLQYQWRFHV